MLRRLTALVGTRLSRATLAGGSEKDTFVTVRTVGCEFTTAATVDRGANMATQEQPSEPSFLATGLEFPRRGVVLSAEHASMVFPKPWTLNPG